MTRRDAPRGGVGHGRITVGWLFGFLCLMVLASVALHWSEATRRVDRLVHDAWVRAGAGPAPEDVVIIAIDPDSLDAIGRWPWPRERQARLLEVLAALGVRGAVLDLLYTEPDADASADTRLAAAIAALPVSILPVLVEGGIGRTVEERLPVPAFSRVVTDIGHIVMPIDDDGIVRRVHLKAGFRRAHWPTLSLAALAALEPDSPRIGEHLPGTDTLVARGALDWRGRHEVLVPFIGPSGSIRQIPAVRLLEGTVRREEIAGRIAFVGLTSSGLGDVVPTPVSALEQPMPGVEMHANVFTALRAGTLVTAAPPWSEPLVALLVLPLVLLVYSRAPPRWSLPGAVLGALLPIVVSFLLYRYARLWFAPLAASVPILASYLLWSRHRLEFVNRFIEREQAQFPVGGPSRHDAADDDAALVDSLTHAVRHLPIRGWRVESRGAMHEGEAGWAPLARDVLAPEWVERGGVWSRRYRAADNVRVELSIEGTAVVDEITAWVDSLVRSHVRERRRERVDAVERLQRNAERLRERIVRLRGEKALGEAALDGGPVGFIVWSAAGEWLRGNERVHTLLPTLGRETALIDFVRVIGREPGAREPGARESGVHEPLADQAVRTSDRQRLDALLLEGVAWQIAHESEERALVVSLAAVGERLAERLICASVDDVSETRGAERARAEMVDYLSHDLQSPLVSALALLGESEREEAVAAQVRRSLAMMDDLLHIARADTLDDERFSTLPLDGVLDNALGGLLPQASARNIVFDVDGVNEALWTTGDATLLERAFGNVIGNAVKYSDAGSRVRVRLEREDTWAVLSVEDDGIGIEPETLDALFTRFRRDKRVVGRIRGSGLGLAFVARVIARHAGSVGAESEPGRGTRVTIRLPLEADDV